MTPFGDYPDEMSFDEFSDGVQSFAQGLKAAVAHRPTPSPQLAELLATGGISVNPTKPRSVFMKIKTYVAGLGVAGKLMLGAGVAAAATTGAGAAGVLPSPVQNAVGGVVATVTPFELPKSSDEHHEAVQTEAPKHEDHSEALAPTPTTAPEHHEDAPTATTTPPPHNEEHPVVTPTTIKHDEPRGEEHPTTSTTVRHEEPRPEPTTTSTTVVAGHGDGDHNNSESIALTCVAKAEPNRIICEWTASSNPEHARYALLRTASNSSQGRVVFQTESQLRYEDHDVVPGVTYTYRVVSLRSDGTTESHSNGQSPVCC